MDAKEIVKALREHAEWAQANEWECPITLGDDLRKAAERIEQLEAELSDEKITSQSLRNAANGYKDEAARLRKPEGSEG